MKVFFYGWVKDFRRSLEYSRVSGKGGPRWKWEFAEWRWDDMGKKITEQRDS